MYFKIRQVWNQSHRQQQSSASINTDNVTKKKNALKADRGEVPVTTVTLTVT